MTSSPQLIPACRGVAVRVSRGQTIKIINTHGTQIVDTWAFNASDPIEAMSMEHSRAYHLHLIPKVGDTLVTNHRRPILTLTEDTSPGVHDTLIAACDIYRYQGLGVKEYHRSCTDNLKEALEELGIRLEGGIIPSPLNLFMNIPWDKEGNVAFAAPAAGGKEGDYVCMRAERDVVVVMSACPQDILKINAGVPKDSHYEVMK